MAIEKNTEAPVTEEDRIQEENDQPEGLPPEVIIGDEPEAEEPQQDFNANLAEDMDEIKIQEKNGKKHTLKV